MRRLLLIDSLGLLYRGHFAMSRNPLAASDGTVTSGLYHLVREILDQMDSLEPVVTVAAMDYPGPCFRRGLYAEYKANRPPMPDELRTQADLARELVPAMGIPMIEREGLEADDIIASLTEQALDRGWEVSILSSDKDLLQLVGPGVTVIRPGGPGKTAETVGEEGVERILGVPPDRVVDLMALTGDSSDNVPGAKGIGPKTACGLIEKFGTLEGIYEHIDDAGTPSVRSKLEVSREMVDLSRELVALLPATELDVSLETLSGFTGDPALAVQLLSRLGMSSLVSRLGEESGGGDLFSSLDHQEFPQGSVSIASSAADIVLPADLPGNAPIAVDTETTSLNPFDASPVGVSVAWSPDDALYVPLAGSDPITTEAASSALEGILSGREVFAQNGKYDMHVLNRMGIGLHGLAGDPMIADYLLRPEDRSHSLSSLSLAWLGRSMRSYSDTLGDADDLSTVETSKVASYCAADSRAAWELSVKLREELSVDPRLLELYDSLELPLASVLTSMEHRGVALDMQALSELEGSFSTRLAELEHAAEGMTGAHINLNSPAQVSSVLFDTLGLRTVRKTPGGGRSSDMDVLSALEGEHPFVGLVLEHRELSKLLNTYIRRLPDFISVSDGLLHTNFSQTVAATGRLSSSGPNLQNIPIRTSRGREVRKCFHPGLPGEVFVTADYSQIELRVLAHLAGPGKLREAFSRGMDIHSATAEAVFGDASLDNRRKAKEVNFSILYGISPWGLSRRMGMDMGEAAGIIDRYMAEYPELKSFFSRCITDAEATGETRTILGRKRGFHGFDKAKGSRRKSMERMVVNTTVQGSAADIVKLAMLRVHRMLGEMFTGSGLVLQVHDELVAVAPEADSVAVAEAVCREMECAMDLEVDLVVETGIGRNWMEAQH